MKDERWIDEWENILKKRSILKHPMFLYEIAFEDNYSYIGISWNPEERLSQHTKNYSNETLRSRLASEKYQLKIHDIIWLRGSLEKEDILIRKLSRNGIKLLNIQSGGRFGERVSSKKPMTITAIITLYEKYYAFKNCT